MSLKLVGIKNTEIFHYWIAVSGFIADALKHADDKFTIDDIQESLIKRDMQLWVVMDGRNKIHATVVTQIVNYPNKKIMLFVLIAGKNFEEWKEFLQEFIDFARAHKCDAVEGYGRRGWEHQISKLGFKPIYTFYSLPI